VTLTCLAAACVAAVAWPAAVANGDGPSSVACKYFTTLFDTTHPAKAVSLAAPGSVATAYAVHETGSRAAARAQHTDSVALVKCNAHKVTSDRAVFTGWRLDEQGRLADFKVNGSALDGRIVQGNAAPIDALGIALRFVSAYSSVSSGGDLVVVLRITGASDGSRHIGDVAYQNAAGEKVTDAKYAGAITLAGRALAAHGVTYEHPILEVKRHATTTALVVFPKQTPGGILSIQVLGAYNPDLLPIGFENETASIPVRGS